MEKAIKLTKKPNEVNFSRNPIVFGFIIDGYNQNDVELNSKLVVTFSVEEGAYSGFFKEVERTLSLDSSGMCEIDVSSIVDNYLSYDTPDISGNRSQLAAKQSCRIYFRARLINDLGQLLIYYDQLNYFVVKGGLKKEFNVQKPFWDKLLSSTQPLHFSYDEEQSLPTTNRVMSCMIKYFPSEINVRRVRRVIHYSDNSSTIWNWGLYAYMGEGPYFKYHIIHIASGWENGGFAAKKIIGKTAVSFETIVEVMDKNTSAWIEESKIKYVYDYRTYYNVRTLYYYNSIGGFEAQEIKASIEISVEYERSNISQYNTQTFSSKNVMTADNRYYNSREREQVKGDTGFLPLPHLERLRDLLNANTAWERIKEHSSLRAITIKMDEVRIYGNEDMLYSMTLNWEDSTDERNYTPTVEEYDSCPAMDFILVTQRSGNVATVLWQLPDGYFKAEIRYTDLGFPNTVNDALHTLLVEGNKGTVGVNVSALIPQNNNDTSKKWIRFWGRVICKDDWGAESYGPWSAEYGITIWQHAAPTAGNLYATTYVGSGSRALLFDNGSDDMLSRSSHPNSNIYLNAYEIGSPAYGSAGGIIVTAQSGTPPNNKTTVSYTPPSAGFRGLDVFDFSVASYWISTNAANAQSFAKMYVNVEGEGNAPYEGNIYVRLSEVPDSEEILDDVNQPGWRDILCDFALEFFSDALGKSPLDVTGRSLTVKVLMEVLDVEFNWDVVNDTELSVTNIKGVSHLIQKWDKERYFRANPENAHQKFKYTLVPDSSYFIL